MGKIFCIMGKSASGKDNVYKAIRSNPDLALEPLVLYTTRPIREGEKDGREYYFVDESRLNTLREQGKIIEERSYDTIHGIWTYFTADEGQTDLERSSYITIGTLESYERLREYYGAEAVVPVYIEVEDGIRLFRALERERVQQIPKYKELCRRFLADCDDFSEENIARLKIANRFSNNNTLEECRKDVEEFILSML